MMNFLGFQFGGITLPHAIVYSPPGTAWNGDRFTSNLVRSTASFRASDSVSNTRALNPLAMVQQQALLSGLAPNAVITGIVDGGADIGPRSNATEVNLLTQTPDILGMVNSNQVMCAAFLTATFRYEAQAPNPNRDQKLAHKRVRAHDVLVTTGFNLAKSTASNGVIQVHSRDKQTREKQYHQVHAEQICITQLDAFLSLIATEAANTKPLALLSTGALWLADMKFDMASVDVDVRIVFDHTEKNVTADCDACSPTIAKVKNKWQGTVRSFDTSVVKVG